MKSISKSELLPTPFVYFSDATARLSRVGDYSAHVYVIVKNQGELGVLLLHSTKYENVFGPGGELKPSETVFEGLMREVEEEAPVLLDDIKAEITAKRVVGMWRRTAKGLHNTFVVECPYIDIWEKRQALFQAIEAEKAGLNRPDYLESDGGLVWVPLDNIELVVNSWKAMGSDGRNNVPTRCFIEPLESQILNIRGFIIPVLEHLSDLYYILRSYRDLQVTFDQIQSCYVHFADNDWQVDDGNLIARRCLKCGVERTTTEDFARGRWVSPGMSNVFCRECAFTYSKTRLTLARMEEQENGGNRLSSLTHQPLLTYERKFA